MMPKSVLVLTDGQAEYGHEREYLQAKQEHPRQDLQKHRAQVGSAGCPGALRTAEGPADRWGTCKDEVMPWRKLCVAPAPLCKLGVEDAGEEVQQVAHPVAHPAAHPPAHRSLRTGRCPHPTLPAVAAPSSWWQQDIVRRLGSGHESNSATRQYPPTPGPFFMNSKTNDLGRPQDGSGIAPLTQKDGPITYATACR